MPRMMSLPFILKSAPSTTSIPLTAISALLLRVKSQDWSIMKSSMPSGAEPVISETMIGAKTAMSTLTVSKVTDPAVAEVKTTLSSVPEVKKVSRPKVL
ncbi:MAG: hypothetical protein COC12_11095 [Rhodobacteraceae bacterium]|nr:MAG: hypothetical protein COC12_11095 [Paracoccaceae bacterium]